ncbi:hypothetical protein M413DRAFT_328441 [Hebeloma cylindrosporum]|uniref:Uncharacterized protein n=1 Tax=Hebeloma cylindrosporum TaxID=76867 RepID=A0A0C3CLR0_HEBCY|nr:hypothetical protein M413DRAFT_328441 [Hebeloma cylindrosporum h7]
MKNALIRGLNAIYAVAPKIKASHPAFQHFLEYIEVVCEMIMLHLQGDEVFLESLSQKCTGYRWVANKNITSLQNPLNALRQLVSEWKRNGNSYQASRLQSSLSSMEDLLVDVLRKQVAKLRGDALPESVSNSDLHSLIIGNMIWLGTNSDISILLPFCMSHHDPRTSQFWPPITADAIAAMPELVKAHPNIWKFAPFNPVTKAANKSF